MKLIWTKADAKRAEKMGWHIYNDAFPRIIHNLRGPFKSSRAAAEWVMVNGAGEKWLGGDRYSKLFVKHTKVSETCRKAILLCCLGGQPK